MLFISNRTEQIKGVMRAGGCKRERLGSGSMTLPTLEPLLLFHPSAQLGEEEGVAVVGHACKFLWTGAISVPLLLPCTSIVLQCNVHTTCTICIV